MDIKGNHLLNSWKVRLCLLWIMCDIHCVRASDVRCENNGRVGGEFWQALSNKGYLLIITTHGRTQQEVNIKKKIIYTAGEGEEKRKWPHSLINVCAFACVDRKPLHSSMLITMQPLWLHTVGWMIAGELALLGNTMFFLCINESLLFSSFLAFVLRLQDSNAWLSLARSISSSIVSS